MDKRWNEVNFSYTEPDEKYIIQEMKKIDKLLDMFCENAGIEKKDISINAKVIKDIIIRVDMRTLYFKIYHNDMKANEYKTVIGLFVFWVLKLRPLWMDIKEDYNNAEIQMATYINERFCIYIVVALLEEYNADFFARGKDLVDAYISELEYSFRYRDLSKESMFLMFDPFYYLYLFNKVCDVDNGVCI